MNAIPAVVQISFNRSSFSSLEDTGGVEDIVINSQRVQFELFINRKNDYKLWKTEDKQDF